MSLTLVNFSIQKTEAPPVVCRISSLANTKTCNVESEFIVSGKRNLREMRLKCLYVMVIIFIIIMSFESVLASENVIGDLINVASIDCYLFDIGTSEKM